jgi:hypothetical protein
VQDAHIGAECPASSDTARSLTPYSYGGDLEVAHGGPELSTEFGLAVLVSNAGILNIEV